MFSSIKAKLTFGFLGLNLLVALGGLTAIALLNPLTKKIEQTTRTGAQALEATEVLVQEVGRVRYYGTRFIEVGTPDDYKQTLALLDTLEKKIAVAESTLSGEENHTHLTALQTLVNDYRKAFTNITQQLDDRISAKMDLLAQIEAIETPLTTFFTQHPEKAAASRPFLFLVTARIHANTYLHTLDQEDFLSLLKSWEMVDKMMQDSTPTWQEVEATTWQSIHQKVKTCLSAFIQFDTGVQAVRTNIKKTLEPLPQQMEEQASALAAPHWGALQRLADVMKSEAAKVQWSIGILLVIVLSLGVIIPFFIARSISRPLQQIKNSMHDVAEGEGDLTARLIVTGRDEVGELAGWFNTFLDKQHSLISQIVHVATQTATAAQQLTTTADQFSESAQQQAAALEETAASMEEMTATVKQNAENARLASQLSVGARDVAEKGGSVVNAAVASMGEITSASKKISEISSVIDEIAFQTNLLALNAAVEAARAGEQGRGFAVVATEVRNLAQRSAGAAKEIKGLIQNAEQKVGDGATLVTKSGETLTDIVTSVKQVSDIMAEISAASQEQSQGLEQVNKTVVQMDAMTQEAAAQTEELSSTAQSLAEQAQQLQTLVSRFKLSTSNMPVREGSMTGADPSPVAIPVTVLRSSPTHAQTNSGTSVKVHIP